MAADSRLMGNTAIRIVFLETDDVADLLERPTSLNATLVAQQVAELRDSGV